jgi:hypothetical protein
MDERRLDGAPEIGLVGHVLMASWMNTVPNSRPSRTVRMSPGAFAFRVERARNGEHLLGEVDQGQRERSLEVKGVVTTTATELEHLAHGDRRRAQQAGGERRLFLVFLGW